MGIPFIKRPRRLLPLISVLLLGGIVYAIGDHPRSTGAAEGTHLDGRPATQQAGSQYLRIATFNIDSGQGLDGKVDLERTARCLQKIDFIGLNEVHGFLWDEPRNQAEAMSDLLHLPYLYVPVEKRWGAETFGNAVLSDLPITRWQRVVLPSETFRAKRNYLLTDARWHGKTIHFLTTHTDWKSGAEAQFKIVRDVFLSLPTPAILMGDLNTPASSPLMQDLKKTPGVEEAIDSAGDIVPGRVDWIFLRGLKAKDAWHVDLKASDHFAYWASVQLK